MSDSERPLYWQADDWELIEYYTERGEYHWWTDTRDTFADLHTANLWAEELVRSGESGSPVGWIEVYYDADEGLWVTAYGEYREYEHH